MTETTTLPLDARKITNNFNPRFGRYSRTSIQAREIGSTKPFERYYVDRRYIPFLRDYYEIKEVH